MVQLNARFSKAGAKLLLFFDMTKYFHKKISKKCIFGRFWPKIGVKMTVLFILDDNDMEIDRLSFYNKQSELSMSSELGKSLDRLPELLMKIYNSGLNHENIEFITDNISVE